MEWERVRDLTLHQSLAVFVPVLAVLVRLSHNRKFGVRTSSLDNQYLCFVRVRVTRQQLKLTAFVTEVSNVPLRIMSDTAAELRSVTRQVS